MLAWSLALWAFVPIGWAAPPADPAYQRLFARFSDSRSLSEKVLNTAGLTTRDTGRSFAVVAGVSSYPNLPDPVLEPAAQDIARLVDYLTRVEGFDEIVVLQNGDMNDANLKYFLQSYFPDRLKLFPKSRFLFAYTGHGFNDGSRGYLLQSSARNTTDKTNSINLNTLKVFVDEVVDSGYQVLVLINSCYSGAFLSRKAFGDRTLLPRNPGAHAITAGASGELSWHDARFGPGSIFFEKLLAGLDGRADKYPDNGDGIVGIEELYAYLRSEIQLATDQKQNPQIGDITRDGALGGFFFFDRRRQVNRGTLAEWRPSNKPISFSVTQAPLQPLMLIQRSPPSAKIHLDDKEVAGEKIAIKPGAHELVAIAAGFHGEVRRFTQPDDVAQNTQSFDLRPMRLPTEAEYALFLDLDEAKTLSANDVERVTEHTLQSALRSKLLYQDKQQAALDELFRDLELLARHGDARAPVVTFLAKSMRTGTMSGSFITKELIAASESGDAMASFFLAHAQREALTGTTAVSSSNEGYRAYCERLAKAAAQGWQSVATQQRQLDSCD